MIVPVIHLFFWSFILILIEKDCFGWLKFNRNKAVDAFKLDDDVVKEAERVAASTEMEAIQVKNFKKVYSIEQKGCCKPSAPLVAVSDLSFALQSGECFALLGVNGAGKSTTFKSLTCEVKPTSGTIKIAGFDVSS